MTTDKQIPQYFIRDTRTNGEKFYRLTDEHPQWLQDAVREAHCGDFPRNWIYETCAAAWNAIREGSLNNSDDVHEWADSMVDVYTKDLASWYADMCHTDTYCQAESEARDCGVGDGESRCDVNKELMAIQYFAISRIASTILQAWEENRDNDDSEESDTVAADKE